MTSFDSVEKLRERANVSYEDAKTALDACGGDLLDALIYLEKQGKVASPGGGSYSSKTNVTSNAIVKSVEHKSGDGEGFKEMMSKFWAWCCKVFHHGNTNYFEVKRESNTILTLPLTILILLLIFAFWITIPLLVVGLFFSCRYSFHGSQIEKIDMNSVMNSAADAADKVKNEVKTAHENYQQQQNKDDRKAD